MGFEIIGWIGATLFCFCALPQTIQVIKQGHGEGLNWPFLWMWFFGEVFCFVYTLTLTPPPIPLAVNYVLNFAMLCMIMWRKKFPTNEPQTHNR